MPMDTAPARPLVTWSFRISAVLWAVWGLVHVTAGILTLKATGSGQTVDAVHGIASAVDVASVTLDYPAAVTAILAQHGFNLLWFGAVTLVSAPFVWRRRSLAVYLAALVGGLADMGYFLFIDLGDLALPPGPQMTWICAAAIISGFAALYVRSKTNQRTT